MSKFSIILPVRNGGEYLKECVNSILAQTFKDFNLVILENASTDGTVEWLQSLEDPRIRLYSSPQSLTIEQNWYRAMEVPKNEFMTLIGHDDILKPDYLASMVELILNHPAASLYQTHFSYIDSKGNLIRESQAMPEKENADSFLSSYLQRKSDVMGTGFMMRSSDYEKLGGFPDYPNLLFADFELWIRLTLLNYKATSAKNCFSFRLHQSTTTISPDTKFQSAFSRFIEFLANLSNENPGLSRVIRDNGEQYLLYYCQGLSHRLLRTPVSQRKGLNVRGFIQDCREYARKLRLSEDFDPLTRPSIRLANIIDSNALSRKLFLAFKKVYSKPVLK